MTNEEMREMTGNVTSSDKLVGFLYLLMRDRLPCGAVETMVMEIEKDKESCVFTNGWLAKYAENLASRLSKNHNEGK